MCILFVAITNIMNYNKTTAYAHMSSKCLSSLLRRMIRSRNAPVPDHFKHVASHWPLVMVEVPSRNLADYLT